MEKPSWAFVNKTYFNTFTQNDTMYFVFSDFEHNWDFFQFLTNDNKYYFCLNKNINSKYNFDVICNTYVQKCKNLSKENIHFILFFPHQEEMIQKYDMLSNHVFYTDFMVSFQIEENLLTHFDTYMYDQAIQMINSKNKLVVDDKEAMNSLKKNIVTRNHHQKDIFSNVVFFGASVTEQKYSYVNYLAKHKQESMIQKKGYSGCHINQAIWLVNDIIALFPKPKCCFLEWITSVYKPHKEDLAVFLAIIIRKLIENDIVPIFLYLYKTDIDEYLDLLHTYEEIASYYHISSIHMYNVIKELSIEPSLILKDSCHTIYEGANLYGSLIERSMEYLVNDTSENYNLKLLLPLNPRNKYDNVTVASIDSFMDCTHLEFEMFNEKKYYKIHDHLIIHLPTQNYTLLAINILYYKHNGFIIINDNRLLTWDTNCYYKRYGYINLNIHFSEAIDVVISQDVVNTKSCKYDTTFPDEKYLFLSELIYTTNSN